MPVAIGLGVASLATGIVGGLSSAQGAKNQANAQYQQAKINQQWAEFEKQLSLTKQRGAMGLAEFDRIFANQTLERESLEQSFYGKQAARERREYDLAQYYRQSKQIRAQQVSSMASRGMGRGGSADAIRRQTEADFANDLARIDTNFDYQMSTIENQRNQALKQRNLRPSDQPPTYIPATPVQPPNTSGMMTGALLGAVAQGLGGLAGVVGAAQPSTSSAPASSPRAQAPGAVSVRPGYGANVGTGGGTFSLGFGGSF